MDILTAEEMLEADRYTIEQLKIPGAQLMELAGRAVLDQILKRRPNITNLCVLCGKGNNGGDGFVVARLAYERGLVAKVVLFAERVALKGDAKIAFEKLSLEDQILVYNGSDYRAALKSSECVVDAIFGISFRGELSGLELEAVNFCNSKKNSLFVVAVDLPSGALCNTGQVLSTAVKSDLTVAIQNFKPVHFLYPGAEFCGESVAVDIGIESQSVSKLSLIDLELIRSFSSIPVSGSSFKNSRGHLIVVAGSPGQSGSALLAARAGLRGGAGLVTLVSDAKSCEEAVTNTPELMTCESSSPQVEELFKLVKGAVVIGPGLADQRQLFERIIACSLTFPLVIDASGLRILASIQNRRLSPVTVLTPHPGEMAALLECTTQDVQADRFKAVRDAVNKYGCVVVLKGAFSVIGLPDGRLFVSPFANANLGTAGSGDVLSGLIGGLLARGVPVVDAAIIGVYVHAYVGDKVLGKGIVGSLASEFADGFPGALDEIFNGEGRV